MPFCHISDQTKDSIVFLLHSQPQSTLPEIARQTGVSKTTIERISSNIYHFGEHTPPSLTPAKRGRPSRISEDVERWIVDYFYYRPHSLQQEVAFEVDATHGVALSNRDISRLLKRLNWSRKVAVRNAAERNEDLRSAWRSRISRYEPHQVVCINESASNERTGWRKYAWAPRGFNATYSGSAQRSERWSILPALSWTGYLSLPLLIQGSITREIFLEWLENDVLPLCNAYDKEVPRERSVLVLDDASIHHLQEVKDLCTRFGVRLEYLPPYSPDFNPIELTFNTLKAWIRNNFEFTSEFEDWGDFLIYALNASGCDTAAKEYFTHAAIVYSSDEMVN